MLFTTDNWLDLIIKW